MINILFIGSVLCLAVGYLFIVVLCGDAPAAEQSTGRGTVGEDSVDYYPRLYWSPPPGEPYNETQARAFLNQTLVEDLFHDEQLSGAE